MSKTKGNTIGITEPANDMYAKLLSISDELMWKYWELLSFRSADEIARLKSEIDAGRNPKDAKVLLAREITARFHGEAAAESAQADFELRARGGVPDEIPQMTLGGAPLPIGALLKQANLAPSTSEALRLVDGGGVRIDGSTVGDRALKLAAGTYVVQVGKRRFARVTLT
jgi:tyrosyl-tRNA synthetase